MENEGSIDDDELQTLKILLKQFPSKFINDYYDDDNIRNSFHIYLQKDTAPELSLPLVEIDQLLPLLNYETILNQKSPAHPHLIHNYYFLELFIRATLQEYFRFKPLPLQTGFFDDAFVSNPKAMTKLMRYIIDKNIEFFALYRERDSIMLHPNSLFVVWLLCVKHTFKLVVMCFELSDEITENLQHLKKPTKVNVHKKALMKIESRPASKVYNPYTFILYKKKVMRSADGSASAKINPSFLIRPKLTNSKADSRGGLGNKRMFNETYASYAAFAASETPNEFETHKYRYKALNMVNHEGDSSPNVITLGKISDELVQLFSGTADELQEIVGPDPESTQTVTSQNNNGNHAPKLMTLFQKSQLISVYLTHHAIGRTSSGMAVEAETDHGGDEDTPFHCNVIEHSTVLAAVNANPENLPFTASQDAFGDNTEGPIADTVPIVDHGSSQSIINRDLGLDTNNDSCGTSAELYLQNEDDVDNFEANDPVVTPDGVNSRNEDDGFDVEEDESHTIGIGAEDPADNSDGTHLLDEDENFDVEEDESHYFSEDYIPSGNENEDEEFSFSDIDPVGEAENHNAELADAPLNDDDILLKKRFDSLIIDLEKLKTENYEMFYQRSATSVYNFFASNFFTGFIKSFPDLMSLLLIDHYGSQPVNKETLNLLIEICSAFGTMVQSSSEEFAKSLQGSSFALMNHRKNQRNFSFIFSKTLKSLQNIYSKHYTTTLPDDIPSSSGETGSTHEKAYSQRKINHMVKWSSQRFIRSYNTLSKNRHPIDVFFKDIERLLIDAELLFKVPICACQKAPLLSRKAPDDDSEELCCQVCGTSSKHANIASNKSISRSFYYVISYRLSVVPMFGNKKISEILNTNLLLIEVILKAEVLASESEAFICTSTNPVKRNMIPGAYNTERLLHTLNRFAAYTESGTGTSLTNDKHIQLTTHKYNDRMHHGKEFLSKIQSVQDQLKALGVKLNDVLSRLSSEDPTSDYVLVMQDRISALDKVEEEIECLKSTMGGDDYDANVESFPQTIWLNLGIATDGVRVMKNSSIKDKSLSIFPMLITLLETNSLDILNAALSTRLIEPSDALIEQVTKQKSISDDLMIMAAIIPSFKQASARFFGAETEGNQDFDEPYNDDFLYDNNSLFTKILIEDITKSERYGFECYDSFYECPRFIYGCLCNWRADLPAFAKFSQHKLHSSFSGCDNCFIVKDGKENHDIATHLDDANKLHTEDEPSLEEELHRVESLIQSTNINDLFELEHQLLIALNEENIEESGYDRTDRIRLSSFALSAVLDASSLIEKYYSKSQRTKTHIFTTPYISSSSREHVENNSIRYREEHFRSDDDDGIAVSYGLKSNIPIKTIENVSVAIESMKSTTDCSSSFIAKLTGIGDSYNILDEQFWLRYRKENFDFKKFKDDFIIFKSGDATENVDLNEEAEIQAAIASSRIFSSIHTKDVMHMFLENIMASLIGKCLRAFLQKSMRFETPSRKKAGKFCSLSKNEIQQVRLHPNFFSNEGSGFRSGFLEDYCNNRSPGSTSAASTKDSSPYLKAEQIMRIAPILRILLLNSTSDLDLQELVVTTVELMNLVFNRFLTFQDLRDKLEPISKDVILKWEAYFDISEQSSSNGNQNHYIHVISHLASLISQVGTLRSYNAFPIERYMKSINNASQTANFDVLKTSNKKMVLNTVTKNIIGSITGFDSLLSTYQEANTGSGKSGEDQIVLVKKLVQCILVKTFSESGGITNPLDLIRIITELSASRSSSESQLDAKDIYTKVSKNILENQKVKDILEENERTVKDFSFSVSRNANDDTPNDQTMSLIEAVSLINKYLEQLSDDLTDHAGYKGEPLKVKEAKDLIDEFFKSIDESKCLFYNCDMFSEIEQNITTLSNTALDAVRILDTDTVQTHESIRDNIECIKKMTSKAILDIEELCSTVTRVAIRFESRNSSLRKKLNIPKNLDHYFTSERQVKPKILNADFKSNQIKGESIRSLLDALPTNFSLKPTSKVYRAFIKDMLTHIRVILGSSDFRFSDSNAIARKAHSMTVNNPHNGHLERINTTSFDVNQTMLHNTAKLFNGSDEEMVGVKKSEALTKGSIVLIRNSSIDSKKREKEDGKIRPAYLREIIQMEVKKQAKTYIFNYGLITEVKNTKVCLDKSGKSLVTCYKEVSNFEEDDSIFLDSENFETGICLLGREQTVDANGALSDPYSLSERTNHANVELKNFDVVTKFSKLIIKDKLTEGLEENVYQSRDIEKYPSESLNDAICYYLSEETGFSFSDLCKKYELSE